MSEEQEPLYEIGKVLKNASDVVDKLAMLSLDPNFSADERKLFKLLARDVLEDHMYSEYLAYQKLLIPSPALQQMAKKNLKKRLDDRLKYAEREMQKARGQALLGSLRHDPPARTKSRAKPKKSSTKARKPAGSTRSEG